METIETQITNTISIVASKLSLFLTREGDMVETLVWLANMDSSLHTCVGCLPAQLHKTYQLPPQLSKPYQLPA